MVIHLRGSRVFKHFFKKIKNEIVKSINNFNLKGLNSGIQIGNNLLKTKNMDLMYLLVLCVPPFAPFCSKNK